MQIEPAQIPAHPGFIAGNWYNPARGMTMATGAALANGSIRLLPFFLQMPVTISDLGCRITSLAAGGNVQLAIYANNPATMRPTGNALASTGSIVTDAADAVSADITGANVSLAPGLYWMAVNADNGTVGLQTVSVSSANGSHLVGATSLAVVTSATTTSSILLVIAQAFGTWPDLTAGVFTESNGSNSGIVFFKAA